MAGWISALKGARACSAEEENARQLAERCLVLVCSAGGPPHLKILTDFLVTTD